MEIKTKFTPGDFVYVIVPKDFFYKESAHWVTWDDDTDLLIIRCCLTSVTYDGLVTSYEANSFSYGRVTKCVNITENCIRATFDEAKHEVIARIKHFFDLHIRRAEAKTKADNSIEEDKL